MVSIETIERGLAQYIDAELLPKLPQDGLKGFGVRSMATAIVMRGGRLLSAYATWKPAQIMGAITPDGAVDIDFLRDVFKGGIQQGGQKIDLPLGVSLRITPEDVDHIYSYIIQAQ